MINFHIIVFKIWPITNISLVVYDRFLLKEFYIGIHLPNIKVLGVFDEWFGCGGGRGSCHMWNNNGIFQLNCVIYLNAQTIVHNIVTEHQKYITDKTIAHILKIGYILLVCLTSTGGTIICEHILYLLPNKTRNLIGFIIIIGWIKKLTLQIELQNYIV